MRNWRAEVVAIVLLLALICGGCGDETLPKAPNASSAPTPLGTEMTMDIYWDATVSMQGFTRLAAGNIYRSLPDTLGAWQGNWGEETKCDVHFFRFGDAIAPVEGREYRAFVNPEIYTEKITSFGNVLDEANPEHLSLVVTDLFESDADWGNISQKLREKYFSRHLTVAVIGVKNSFSGDIFDIGLDAAHFYYDSGDDPARFRPFYLFVMGSEAQVRAFLTKWEKEFPFDTDVNCVVFSEHFTAARNVLTLADATKKSNILGDNRLTKEDNILQEVSFANDNQEATLVVPADCTLLPYVCLKKEKIKDLNKVVKIYSLSNDTWVEQEGAPSIVPFENDDDIGNYCKFSFITDNDGKNCEFRIGFIPDDIFPSGQIDLMGVQLLLSPSNLDLPDWIYEWDMGNIDAEPNLFDGTKTINLKRIGESLKDALLTGSKPSIAEIYLVTNKH